MNTNRDFITKEQFENYLKDVCGNTHANIAEKYNINSIKGVISSINPDYKKYIDVIKQNNDMFINLAHEDHFSFIEMINLFTCSKDMYYLKIFKETKFPVWNILFNSHNNNLYYLPEYDNRALINFVNSNIDFINSQLSFKEFSMNNFEKIIDKMKQIISNPYMEGFYIENELDLFQKLTIKSFNIRLWEEYIENCICIDKFFRISNLFDEYKWVFANLTNFKMLDTLQDKIQDRISTYNNSYCSNKFAPFCVEMKIILEVFIKISEINDNFKLEFMNFLKNNINYIVVLHNQTNLLSKIMELDISLFRTVDDSGYNPFTDVIRYGDYKTNKWFIDNILTNINYIEDAFVNCFVNNTGMMYLLENSDYRIVELVFNVFEANPVLLNINSILYIPVSNDFRKISSFSKKVKSILKFIEKTGKYYLLNNDNFVKDALLYQESLIENSNFQPFILSYMYSINSKYSKNSNFSQLITLNYAFCSIEIHEKYFNKQDLKKIIDISKLKDDNISDDLKKERLCNFIKINFWCIRSSKNKMICFCKLKNLVNFIVDYIFNTNFSHDNINGFFEALKFIKFKLLYDSGYHYENNVFNKAVLFLNKSLEHKCMSKNSDLYKSIAEFLEVSTTNISLSNPYKSIGVKRNINYTKEIFEFTKVLTERNLHFNNMDKLYFYNLDYHQRKHIRKSNFKEHILCQYCYNKEDVDLYYDTYKKNKFNQNLKLYLLRLLNNVVGNVLKNCIECLEESKINKNVFDIYEKIKISTSIENRLLEKMPVFYSSYNIDTELADFKTFIGFYDDKIIYPKKLQKFQSFLKDNINKIKKFKTSIESFIKSKEFEYQTEIYLNAIFRIKHMVKHKLKENFTIHMNKYNQNLKELEKRYIISESKTKEPFVEDEEDILEQLKVLLEDDFKVNEIDRITITRPTLLTFDNLLACYETHSVITQKVDGVTNRNIKLSNSFPKLQSNITFDVEFEMNDNMNFIIGISKSNQIEEKTFIEYIYKLRQLHSYTKGLFIPEKISVKHLEDYNFREIIYQEAINYKKYIKDSKKRQNKGKTLWWPKMFYCLEYSSFNELIYMLNYFQSNPYLKIFKNDGWILQHKMYKGNDDTNLKFMNAFKIKEFEQITIDLEWRRTNNKWVVLENDNETYIDFEEKFKIKVTVSPELDLENYKVYRCYPLTENKLIIQNSSVKNFITSFEARDLRADRKKPNTIDITYNCIKMIKNPIIFSNVLKLISQTGPYYSKETFGHKSNLTKKLSSYSSNLLSNYISGNVLDLGGGYKTKYYLKKFHQNINSIASTDIDINILIKNILKNNKNEEVCDAFQRKISFNYLDFTRSTNDYCGTECHLSLKIEQKYNTITLFNCINYALKNDFTIKTFFNHINSLCKIGGNIVIKFMDLDAFKEALKMDNISINENIIIKSVYDSSFINMNISKLTNRIYYEWVHKSPMEESIIGKQSLINLFEMYGWKFIYYKHHDKFNKSIQNLDTLWEHYFYSFSDIVFEYQGI